MSEQKEDTISLKDFKSWLQGVEDMQEDDWIPNAVQWKKIRSKINLLDDAQQAPYRQNNSPVVNTPQYMSPMPMPIPMPSPSQGFSSAFDTYIPPPAGPSILASPKTPDIDTSDGSYQTGYL
jgi:hypothetical protein